MTSKLLIILLTLAIWTQCFADWTPDKGVASLSICSPYEAGVAFDYEALIGLSDSTWRFETAFEREDGKYYGNLDLWLRKPLYGDIRFEIETKEKPASKINNQSAMIGWKYFGYGAVTQSYDIHKTVDAFWIGIPLPGYEGNLTLTTDFSRIHIWEGWTEYVFNDEGQFRPFVKAVIYIEKPYSEFYQFKFGIKYVLKTD